MSIRERLRAAAHDLLRREAGVVDVVRLCPRCGSGEHGAPHAVTSTGRAPSVSLSYAGDVAVVAWSATGPVGIDVERDGPDRAAWTRHEALVKATGLGLDATALPELPTAPLALPAGYVGTLAGVDVEWRLVCDTLAP